MTTLKRMNAKKINGDYVAIIHPDVAYDLMNDPNGKRLQPIIRNLYAGEIGRLYGVRFVETSEAKILKKQEQVLLMYILLCSSAQMLRYYLRWRRLGNDREAERLCWFRRPAQSAFYCWLESDKNGLHSDTSIYGPCGNSPNINK
ncbi:MAG: hypothetical protein ACLSGI_11325 [Butyricicoccaceae bacterium]